MANDNPDPVIDILSRSIDALAILRQTYSLGQLPTVQMLDNGMTRSHLAEALCFDLKHNRGAHQ